MSDKKPFRLLKLPTNQDLISNKIEALDQALVGHEDLLYYLDELLCVAENHLLQLDPNLSVELNTATERLGESRYWIGEFITAFEMACAERKNNGQ